MSGSQGDGYKACEHPSIERGTDGVWRCAECPQTFSGDEIEKLLYGREELKFPAGEKEMKVPYQIVRKIADKIVESLAPHCERIEIAGSLRRLRPAIGDIDLVAIPRFASKSSLFGPAPLAETDFMAALLDFAEDDDGNSRASCSGDKIVRFKTRWEKSGFAGEITVDCYIATPESWATLLLIRTGSAEHNIWLAQRAKACGGKLHADGSGLELPGQYDPIAQRVVNSRVVRAQTEEEIFKALGLPLPPPADRECKYGRPVWLREGGLPT